MSAMLPILLEGEPFSVVVERPESNRFWRSVDDGTWERDTLRFVRNHVRPGTVFIDIGAWIGPIALYASRFADKVLALEPDPIAQGELEHNVSVNADNIEIWRAGVDVEAGTLTLYAPSGLGQSITSSFGNDNAQAITVRTVTFDQISASLSPNTKVVCKVDIEGHEYQVIDAIVAFARTRAAPLHISLHPKVYYTNSRRSRGPLAARIQTWAVTCDLVRKLSSLGVLTSAPTGAPFSRAKLFGLIFLRRSAKNFSVEVNANSIPAEVLQGREGAPK